MFFVQSLLVSLVIQSPVDAAVDKAVAAYSELKSTRADFEQTVTNALTGSTLKARGTFEQLRPNRFAFRFTDPKGDMIVADGKYVWLYLPSSTPDQVIRASLSSGAAGALDLIDAFFVNPRSRYTIADGGAATVNGRQTRAVKLTPKDKDSAFEHATVWIDLEDGTIRQLEASEVSGVKRKVVVTSFTPNPPVQAQSFTFRPPKGVKVVTQESLGIGR
jgi:outer membrane lipoprotein carrier protein